MRRFARLYDALDRTTSTNAKVAAMVAYFREAPPEDAAWALFFLGGQRPKRLIGSGPLVAWAIEEARIPGWLFEECLGAVGDFAEAVALLLEAQGVGGDGAELPLHVWVEQRLLPLRGLPPEAQRERVVSYWRELPSAERFLFHKLVTGELRVGVSATLVQRALAELSGLPPAELAHRLMGPWEPSAAFFHTLLQEGPRARPSAQPYPFCLAYPLDEAPERLGSAQGYLVEWKWDGIRAQLLVRGGERFLWSRGEEELTLRFPELVDGARALPDGTVLDGEVMAYRDGAPLPFSVLQRRIGRQKLTPRVLEEAPCAFVAYDLLEQDGGDLRAHPLRERRARLEALLAQAPPVLRMSPRLEAQGWEDFARLRAEARQRNVEGLMLKRLDSPYGAGRRRGDWWKWKVDPHSVDAVLVYSQYGSGRRASLFTDHTFAVWHEGKLLPVAKAYSGLTDEELTRLDAWIRAHIVEKFGPVRAVEPTQVFELHFENIAESPRHKSGLAVRFPRIARWRTDKPAAEADSLETLRALLAQSRAHWARGPADADADADAGTSPAGEPP